MERKKRSGDFNNLIFLGTSADTKTRQRDPGQPGKIQVLWKIERSRVETPETWEEGFLLKMVNAITQQPGRRILLERRILSNPVMESAYYTTEKYFWAVTADDANAVILFIVFAAAIATRNRVML